MVFKPFTHLARQSFAKSLTHGYAQSVVAATQSSYASTTTQFPFSTHSNRVGKPGTSQFQTAFQHASNQSSTGAKHTPTASGNDANVDAGLAAYYSAWKKHQRVDEDKEWKQFQFPKRIEWKTSESTVDVKGKEKDDGIIPTDSLPIRESLDRSYSAGVVDDIKRVEDEIVAVAEIDKAIAEEIRQVQSIPHIGAASNGQIDITEPLLPLVPETSSTSTGSSLDLDSPISDRSTATSAQSTESASFTEHLDLLERDGRYAEIPPVFESMLRAGLRPTAEAYNALLTAAISLPIPKHHVVPKALDAYADMLRRDIAPNTKTYSILLDLLSRRALNVLEMKATLEVNKHRFSGMRDGSPFLFRSHELDHDMLREDNSIGLAIKLFGVSTGNNHKRIFPTEIYRVLIEACAAHGNIEQMIRVFSHMEANKVVPHASIFAPMIRAFASCGDLRSVVECYNEYKSLAISDDQGNVSINQRDDHEVYAAVVKAYAHCGRAEGGYRFLGRIADSFDTVAEPQKHRLDNARDAILLNGLIQERVETGNLKDALKVAEEADFSASARNQAMIRVCTAAADTSNVGVATKAYENANADKSSSPAASAMLAMHIRQCNLLEARSLWDAITSDPASSLAPELTAMYASALIESGHVDEGLMQASQSFAKIRSQSKSSITEEIDESIEQIGSVLSSKGISPSPQASLSFLRGMLENDGLVSPVAERLLAGLGPDEIVNLNFRDLTLALQIEADIIRGGLELQDVAHLERFAYIVRAVIASRMSLDENTSKTVESCLENMPTQYLNLIGQWQNYRYPPVANLPISLTPQPKIAAPTSATYDDTFDPHAATTDFRGSTFIIDELERHGNRGNSNLNEALSRFKNMRRAGRHPRYNVYAKLISAAAKDGRYNLTHDILGMARQDIPLLAQFRVVRHGWSMILDSMLGATLTSGNSAMAGQYHRELLNIGAAPTANTFGLYITTMKESTKTYDEATEAVKIFHRAKSEGVEPSSFLYNALIGKLGKARRIDDCLFYFAEMRSHGIRPTSVTYGTVVNALCRVSDEKFAEELFDEMESMPNYKPRPAPYNSLMQFFLITKRDSAKVLAYYDRMQTRNIQPTMHTFKILIDTYATLDPVDMVAAERILDEIRASGQHPEAVHYAALIHARGCTMHDMDGARAIFDTVLSNSEVRPQACLYQALFESMVANHQVKETDQILKNMNARSVQMTPYIANTLIHGWAMEGDIEKSIRVYDSIGKERREPSTYEAMTRAFLSVEDRVGASATVREMLSRGYPSAVSGKILELLGHGHGLGRSTAPAIAANLTIEASV
ncbi:hypothetical protein MMC09_005123 [Bachmanniomyces sp. S44760]|nr:hypothetical protein [Bachmanniomyces sp. S44760]